MKTPIEQLNELLEQKKTKRLAQSEKERQGYDAGWIDALTWIKKELEKHGNEQK